MAFDFQGIVDVILNPVFGWLLNIPPILAILFLSVLLGLLSTLLQKYMTDQAKMRRLREDTKRLQKQMKEYQKAKEQDKMMKVQQKMMPLQMQLMKESFRPLIVTMLPFLLIFFWLSNHFAFFPIEPGVPFTVTAKFDGGGNATLVVPDALSVDEPTKRIEEGIAVWTVQGPAGEYDLTLQYASGEFPRKVLITHENEYIKPVMPLKGTVEEFNVDNAKVKPVPWFWVPWGDNVPGWIFWYILFSIPVSLGLKKLLKVV